MNHDVLDKANPRLKAILTGEDQDKITVFLALAKKPITPGQLPEIPMQENFTTSLAFREAMVARAKSKIELEVGDALKALEAIGLHPQYHSSFVIVRGSTAQIKQALTLNEVTSAIADFGIEIELLSGKSKESLKKEKPQKRNPLTTDDQANSR